jgi:cytochrome bd-type quinol oxidase subunit 2
LSKTIARTKSTPICQALASLWPYVVPRQATIWTAAADRSALEFVGAGLLVLLPVILAYLGHAYWVFRGKVTAAYGEAAGEPRVEAKSDNLAS